MNNIMIEQDYRDNYNKRRDIVFKTPQQIELNEKRRKYVRDFILSRGYIPHNLKEDIIIDIFKRLSRMEEYATLEKHNKHNWEKCFAPLKSQKEGFEPIIDSNVQQWAEEYKWTPISFEQPLWPDNKIFALCLTHDVDILSPKLLKNRLRSLRFFRKAPGREQIIVGLSTGKEIIRSLYFWKDIPDLPLNIWLEEEAKHGFSSSLFFMASPLPQPTWEDPFYCFHDSISFEGKKRIISDVIRELSRRGWDIGLHGSSNSSFSPKLLQEEKQLLEVIKNDVVDTVRQHHLLYDIRYTPFFQSISGFKADSTLGSNMSISFRCGTSFPFFIYDLISDQTLDILEVPLIIQDVALFGQMGLNDKLAIEKSFEAMHQVAKVNGVFTLLWHNHYHRDSLQHNVYRILLEEAKRMGAWGCSLKQLNDWWRMRLDNTRILSGQVKKE